MQINFRLLLATALSLSIVSLDGWRKPIQGADTVVIPHDFFAIQNSSRQFFQAGRNQLEQDIQHLESKDFDLEDLLFISEDLLLEQKYFLLDQSHDWEDWLNQDFVKP